VDDIRCVFHLRWPARSTGHHYLNLDIDSPSGYGPLPLSCPPAVGDLVNLNGRAYRTNSGEPERVHGTFRVVERAWSYPEYGSNSWPRGEPRAKVGPRLDVFVEHAEGAFADQVEGDEELPF
jgi:hypothetical protein